MSALDRLIPTPRLLEIDHVDLGAPPARVWESVRHGELARSPFARALFAVRTLPAGHTLAREDLALKSPADGGLPPYELDVVIGRTLRHPVAEDAAFTFDDLEELLDSDAIDGLVVATPNHLHEPHVLSALRAGVDVLCERPLALSSRGVERVLAAATKSGRRVVVGNNHRFRNDVQALSRFVSTGELGRVVGVRAGAYTPVAPPGWRQRRAESGGGAFLAQRLALATGERGEEIVEA